MEIIEKYIFKRFIFNNKLELHKNVENTDISFFVNKIDEDGNTLLHYACMYSKFYALVAKCLELKFDINLQNKNGKTPMHLACSHNYKKIINELLINNVDLNLLDEFGNSPLFYISRDNNIKLIKKLIKNGANYNILNNENQSILEYVIDRNRNFPSLYSDNIEYFKSLGL